MYVCFLFVSKASEPTRGITKSRLSYLSADNLLTAAPRLFPVSPFTPDIFYRLFFFFFFFLSAFVLFFEISLLPSEHNAVLVVETKNAKLVPAPHNSSFVS